MFKMFNIVKASNEAELTQPPVFRVIKLNQEPVRWWAVKMHSVFL